MLSKSQRVLLWLFIALFIVSGFSLLNRANQLVTTEVPAPGGVITEGVVGAPRFVNPLLALSDADRDLAALVYAGLFQIAHGQGVEPELAATHEVSDDGRVYTVTVRDDARFHDGEPVTADDVLFTIRRAQDPSLKSPKRANWEGVEVEKVDERTVRFTLEQPYAPFLENLTLGILPEHIWEGVDIDQFSFSQFNIEPIGAGPYRISDIDRNASGVPERYTLVPFANYVLGKPYLSKLRFTFYPNEEVLLRAYRDGAVDHINSVSPRALTDEGIRTESAVYAPTLPRIFGVFFNQNRLDLFAEREVRRALDIALDKERIVEDVLAGYGTAIDFPVPPGMLRIPEAAYEQAPRPEADERIETARALLTDNGWVFDEEEAVFRDGTGEDARPLAFMLATSNTGELRHTAELLKAQWEELGARVDVQFFAAGDLNQNVIRPRNYDALLFGEIVGRELDLFAFWHSSQRNDPGLNIALYANITADAELEAARAELERDARHEHYRTFLTEVANDTPAVSLYSPDFIYVADKRVAGIDPGFITTPSDRLAHVHEWHVYTNKVWGIFHK